MKKRNGFTLIELLAVIVILAIILVIAVPKILNTIEAARKSSMEDSVKLIATQAEKQLLINQTQGSTAVPTCSDAADFSSTEYTACTLTWGTGNDAGKVTGISVTGGGKFDGYTCSMASGVVTCTK